MKWLQLSLVVSGKALDSAIDALEQLGSQATTQQNAGEDSYYDLAHPAEPKWDKQMLSGLFQVEDHTKGKEKSKALRQALLDVIGHDFVIEINLLEDQNWETAWIDQYRPIEIAPKLWIYPSWENVSENHAENTIIKIDPGMAFGTGTHETTRLCMKAISRLDKDKLADAEVLDYGCGSGILAITSLKLGAATAVGVDIDAKAEQVSKENALNNGVDKRFAIQSAGDISGQTYALVIANILASALIELAPTLIKHTRDNGLIILSGILLHQAQSVIKAYQSNFDFTSQSEGDWIMLLGKKISR